jgi:predicted nucleic-acid-binding protein
MNKVVVDTNVLLSFLTDRDERQQGLAAELIEAAAGGEHMLLLHQLVLTEMVYVLLKLYDLDSDSVAIILRDLLEMPGVQPLDEIDWGVLLELWPQQVGDFADAGLAAVLSGGGYDSLATFDLSFSRAVKKQGLSLFW